MRMEIGGRKVWYTRGWKKLRLSVRLMLVDARGDGDIDFVGFRSVSV